MKTAYFYLLLFFSPSIFSQRLDIGFDFKYNANTFKNQFDNGFENKTIITSSDIIFPEADFSFFDEYGDEFFVTYHQTSVNNNFELPLYVKFSTKKHWFFDARFSAAKYQLQYEGITRHPKEYYYLWYGTFEEFQASVGGQMDGESVDINPELVYNDEIAYSKYMQEKMRDEQGAIVKYYEEFKLRSVYFGMGYKFAPQKALRPYIYGAVGYRSRVTDYGFQHFDIPIVTYESWMTQRDVSKISKDIPSYGNQLFSGRFELGVEKYKYHAGISAEFIFGQYDTYSTLFIQNYSHPTGPISALSFYIGADLFNFTFNTIDKKKDIYNEEYDALQSKLYNNRKWSFGFFVKAPMANQLNNYGNYTINSMRDVVYGNLYDSAVFITGYTYESLTFGEVLKAEWSPRFENSLRFNIFKRLDAEIVVGFSRLQLDTKVTELKTAFRYFSQFIDDTTTIYYWDYDDDTKINTGVYRANFFTTTTGINLYFTILSNGYIDFRMFGGVATNFLVYSLAKQGLGINGNGDDIYREVDDVYSNPENYIDQFNGIWYSTYQGGIDLNDDPWTMMGKFDEEGDAIGYWDRLAGIKNNYYTVHFGLEAEINKFIFGACADMTISPNVDGFFIRDYYNINLTLGYLLFTKNKLEQKKEKVAKN